MSPRLMSISSASAMVTDMFGERLARSDRPTASTPAMVDVRPDGSTITSSPGSNAPPATVPAKPR